MNKKDLNFSTFIFSQSETLQNTHTDHRSRDSSRKIHPPKLSENLEKNVISFELTSD